MTCLSPRASPNAEAGAAACVGTSYVKAVQCAGEVSGLLMAAGFNNEMGVPAVVQARPVSYMLYKLYSTYIHRTATYGWMDARGWCPSASLHTLNGRSPMRMISDGAK